MKNFTNKSGFTLVEIVVVLLIVGILAAIALPNLFSNIPKSKGSQAMVMLDGAKSGMEAYYVLHNGQTPVSGDIAAAGLVSTSVISGTTFSLTLPTAAVAQGGSIGQSSAAAGNYGAGTLVYTLMVSDGTSGISLSRNTAGSWACSAPTVAPYTGLC